MKYLNMNRGLQDWNNKQGQHWQKSKRKKKKDLEELQLFNLVMTVPHSGSKLESLDGIFKIE